MIHGPNPISQLDKYMNYDVSGQAREIFTEIAKCEPLLNHKIIKELTFSLKKCKPQCFKERFCTLVAQLAFFSTKQNFISGDNLY